MRGVSTYHQKLLLAVMFTVLLLGSVLLLSGVDSGFGLLFVLAGLAGAVFFVILCWRIISRGLDEEQCRIVQRLHTLANTSPAIFWSAGLDKGCDWFNQRWLDFTGRTMEQESGDGWAQGVHPDDLERCLTLYTNAFDARESFTIEYRLRRHDGEYRWLLDQGMPRYDGAGAFVGYLGSCLDITEEKKLRETLAASEANYRQLFEANPHPMWVYDLETLAFLAVNHAAEKHYGYSREEFLNMTIKDIRPPEDVPRLMQTVTNVKKGLSHSGQWHHLIKDGRVIDVEITSHLLLFEGRQAKLVLAHDVTERNHAEESLRESEQRYRELIESANSAILHWSSDGNITFINEFAQKFFGWSADEIVGQPINILVPERESTGANLASLVEDVAAHPERYLNNINENICRDGHRVWMSWTNRALRDEQGRITGILTVGNDITELRRVEEDLRRRNEELELFSEASVGRELQMIAMKREINDLAGRLGQKPPYDLSFADETGPSPS